MARSSPFDHDHDDDAEDPIYRSLMRHGDDGPDFLDIVRALTARPAWHASAACRGLGPDVFYLAKGGDPRPARDLCAGCTVAEPCASAADGHGIWAGTSPMDRRGIRSSGHRPAA